MSSGKNNAGQHSNCRPIMENKMNMIAITNYWLINIWEIMRVASTRVDYRARTGVSNLGV